MYLLNNIYMDVIAEVQVLETDVKDCEEKCKTVNFVADSTRDHARQ